MKIPKCQNCKENMKLVSILLVSILDEDSNYGPAEYTWWCENCGSLLQNNNNDYQEKFSIPKKINEN